MKKLILVLAIVVETIAPAKGQDTFVTLSDGPLIEALRGIIADYVAQDWDSYGAAFADTVKFYSNTTEATSLENKIASHKQGFTTFENVEISSALYLSIETPGGETWALVWAAWTAKVIGSDEQITVPVHVAARFENGKVVVERGYWDNEPINAVAAAMQ